MTDRFLIKGELYELASYGEKFSDQSRQATVRRVCGCRYEGEDKCCHEDCTICNPPTPPIQLNEYKGGVSVVNTTSTEVGDEIV